MYWGLSHVRSGESRELTTPSLNYGLHSQGTFAYDCLMKYFSRTIGRWRQLLSLKTNRRRRLGRGEIIQAQAEDLYQRPIQRTNVIVLYKSGYRFKTPISVSLHSSFVTALSPAIILYSVTISSWHQSLIRMPLFRVVCLCWKCSRRPLRSLPFYTFATKIPKLPMAPMRPDPSFGMIHLFLVAAPDNSVVNINKRSTPSGDVAKACSFTLKRHARWKKCGLRCNHARSSASRSISSPWSRGC